MRSPGDWKKVSKIRKIGKNLAVPLAFIILGALSRLLPHLPNATPVGALALFSGFYLPKKQAFLVPLLAMAAADLFLGGHSTLLWVYGSFLLIVALGFLLKGRLKAENVILTSLSSSILFFLITNFGVWASTSMYSKDLAGLLQSYVMGIPFLRPTVLGDLFYSGVIFGSYALFFLRRKEEARAKTAIKNINP